MEVDIQENGKTANVVEKVLRAMPMEVDIMESGETASVMDEEL